MSDMGHVRSDDIEGAIEGTLRTMVTAAGRMGERLARIREDAARRAEAESVQRAREYQAQLEQERATARAQLLPVNEPAWWDRASANDIAHAYETAAAWEGEDRTIAGAAAKMRDELRERYDIDTAQPGSDSAAVRAAIEERNPPSLDQRIASVEAQLQSAESGFSSSLSGGSQAEHDRRSRAVQKLRDELRTLEAEREEKSAAPVDEDRESANHDRQEAASLIDNADRHDRAVQENAGDKWDSAERRDGHAAELAAAGVEPIAIQAQYGADVSNAKHPRGAVAPSRGAAKARKTPTKNIAAQRDRGERSR